jgi:chromosome segregation ATPase
MEKSENQDEKANALIKDLQSKIKVLKQGVMDERGKRSDMEKEILRLKSRVFEYEIKVNEQDNMICNLSKEKHDLLTKLEIEKTKVDTTGATVNAGNMGDNIMNLIGGIFQRRDSIGDSDSGLKKLQSENADLMNQVETLRERMESTMEDHDRVKMEYQNLLNLQVERLKKVELELQEKNRTIHDNSKKLESLYETYRKIDIEKTRYESRLNEYIESDRLKNEKIIELLTRLEEKEYVIIAYKENLSRHEVESAGLARKLAELKNAIIEQNMIVQSFKGERVNHSNDSAGVPLEVEYCFTK